LTFTIISGARKDLGGCGHHLGTGGHVLRIGQVDRGTGIVLHKHLMAMGRELAHAGWRQADTVFMVLDSLGTPMSMIVSC
jgi:hypothetical protein